MIAKNQYWVLAKFNIKLQMVAEDWSTQRIASALALQSQKILLFSLTNRYILTMINIVNAKFATNLMRNTLMINPLQL